MQLSSRLRTIADTVTKGNRVADVGCDHAYISIYLIENGIAPKVVAMDVNKGPLLRARENISNYGYEGIIDTRLSDGLRELKVDEADTVIIGGMGGALTVRILEEGRDKLAGVYELILQPQSEIFLVRKFLHDNYFKITQEKMVKDEGKYYTVIKAVRAKTKETYEKEIFYLYGKCLLEDGTPILEEYLLREHRLRNQVIQSLSNNASQKSETRLLEVMKEQKQIEEALNVYKYGIK